MASESSLNMQCSSFGCYLTRIAWLQMLVGKTSSLPTVLYDTVTRLQWTTTSVLIFTRETGVRSPSTGAIHAPVIFGFHAVVATL